MVTSYVAVLLLTQIYVSRGLPVFSSQDCECCSVSGNPDCCSLCQLSEIPLENNDNLESAYRSILERLSSKYDAAMTSATKESMHAKRQRGRKGTYDERFYKFQIGRKRGPHRHRNDIGQGKSEKRSDPFFHGPDFGKRANVESFKSFTRGQPFEALKRGDPFFHAPGFRKRSNDMVFHGADWGKRTYDGLFLSREPEREELKHNVRVSTNQNSDNDVNGSSEDTETRPRTRIEAEHRDELQDNLQKRNLNPRVHIKYIRKPWHSVPFLVDGYDVRTFPYRSSRSITSYVPYEGETTGN